MAETSTTLLLPACGGVVRQRGGSAEFGVQRAHLESSIWPVPAFSSESEVEGRGFSLGRQSRIRIVEGPVANGGIVVLCTE